MRNSLRQAASSEAPAAPETTMLLRVITHTPFCIWLLLAGLVALGRKQSRDRLVGPPQ